MEKNDYKHIILKPNSETDRYINPQGGGSDFNVYNVNNRTQHGNRLKSELQQAVSDYKNLLYTIKEEFPTDDLGISITFESWDGFELKFQSLEDKKSKIEIVSIKKINNKFLATVYIPEGKIKVFFDKIDAYLNKLSPKGNPRNQELIANIETIKLATIEQFWNDTDAFPENHDHPFLLEIWLRVGNNREEIINSFKAQLKKININISDKFLKFPENSVFLVKASINQLKKSVLLLDCLSEIRLSKETPATFLEMPPIEENEWGLNLKERVILHPDYDHVSVCILDTGVNFSHPLLEQSITEQNTDTYNPSWGKTDHPVKGHGTEMAGLALYGDLYPLLLSNFKIELKHSLESVKMLPPNGENPKELYGIITRECVSRADLFGINKRRFFNMAVTSNSKEIYEGEASSWSASIDQIAFGNDDTKDTKKLFLISAGNLEDKEICEYPKYNFIKSIEDPSQSWNCITVGAYTEKLSVEKRKYPEYDPIAKKGELSPSSKTSCNWGESDWPIKPDIVMEGGNQVKNKSNFISKLESLSLITTNNNFQSRLLTMCCDTSAATAQASRYAALISSEYPKLWHETIRGLIVHSADYEKLKMDYLTVKNKDQRDKIKILRTYGYGFPNIESALKNRKDYCTIIIQDEIYPFIKNGSNIEFNEIKFYDLPWPKEVLQEIPMANIELKITLSYFIEPNPKIINTKLTSTYASCGLRFDSNASTEELQTFKKRVNKKSREKIVTGKYESGFTNPDNNNWVLGKNLRNHGSIHSDIWMGSAAQLTNINKICIYPVGGWWRTRKKLEKYNNKIRFSLIISIKTEKTNIDIYNAIANIIKINNIPIQT